MNILKQILGDTPLETFLQKHFTRLPFSVPHGALPFTELLNWPVVDEIIKSKKSVLRIVHNGKVIKDYVDLSCEEAHLHHHQGHTLLVRYAERADQKLKDLSQDFAKAFYTDVDIQLYCTPEGHNAFGWHYDVEEVFIFQTEGSKTYTIRPNTWHPNPLVASIPKDLGYENEKTPQQLTVTLEKGDWLYIPSGWWHIAKTQKESMHISIGLMPNSALDILSFAPQFFAKFPLWRKRMPVHQKFDSLDEEVAFYQEAMGILGAELTQHMASREFIEAFLRYKKK